MNTINDTFGIKEQPEGNHNIIENANQPNNSTVSIDPQKILEWGLYALGVILIIVSLVYFFNDLDIRSSGDIYEFKEKQYVGGDAYNYIISAARSSAVMTKSLVFAVFGSSAILAGRLTAIISKMK